MSRVVAVRRQHRDRRDALCARTVMGLRSQHCCYCLCKLAVAVAATATKRLARMLSYLVVAVRAASTVALYEQSLVKAEGAGPLQDDSGKS